MTLSALALQKNGAWVAMRDRAFQIDPPPVHRPAYAAGIFGVAVAQLVRRALQLAHEFRPLQGAFVEEFFWMVAGSILIA